MLSTFEETTLRRTHPSSKLRNLLVSGPSFTIFVLHIYTQDTIEDNERFEDTARADHTGPSAKAPKQRSHPTYINLLVLEDYSNIPYIISFVSFE